jgi:hypothetical protein
LLRIQNDCGKFTFAEVEENEAGLAKLRTWLATVSERDIFGASMRGEVELKINDADTALAAFAERAAADEENAAQAERPV